MDNFSLRPNLLCIGAPKCGTSWLAGMLASHPEIFIPAQKELNVLHYDDCEARLDEYQEFFRQATAVVRGDFSVRYLTSHNAPDNAIRFLEPGFKILCLVRDPVEQITSHYWHLRRQNFHQPKIPSEPPTLLEAIHQYPESLLEPALYHKHLNRWLEHVSNDRLLVIDYHELVSNTQETLLMIADFLEVDRSLMSVSRGNFSDTQLRRGVQPRKGLAGRIYPRLYTAVSRGPYQWFKNRFGVMASEKLKRRLRLSQISQTLFFEPGYPEPTPAEQLSIRALVEEDQRNFAENRIGH